MAGRYTGIGKQDHDVGVQAIRSDLNRNMGKVILDIQDEAVYAFDTQVGDYKDWSAVSVYPTVLQIVALLSGRTFVGLPLCRDKEWRDATIKYTIDTSAAMNAIQKYSSFIRPFVSPFLPELRKLRAYQKFAVAKMGPVIESAIESRKRSGAKSGKESDSDTYNLVHWMVSHYQDLKKVDLEELAEMQMLAAFAAIHTSSMALSHVIFDLAAHPEVVAELRVEIERVFAEESLLGGKLQKTCMPKLKKLDSFIKESQRMSPNGASKSSGLYWYSDDR